ncbi:DUF2794 domain-containing protein [Enterovirga sp. CN4-39]|uniref:DUF2794 domain-containing protein n=1 Tax=Enterovirga sp. CN4-39 TaxID=3400910 RepID=UPI003C0ECEE0
MNEGEQPEILRSGGHVVPFPAAAPKTQVTFSRDELRLILNVYGRMVAEGEWRDYAMDFERDRAVFSVFRRASEMPLYRIVKEPSLARRQGAYSVVAAGGRVLKRGHELDRVVRVLEPLRVVAN